MKSIIYALTFAVFIMAGQGTSSGSDEKASPVIDGQKIVSPDHSYLFTVFYLDYSLAADQRGIWTISLGSSGESIYGSLLVGMDDRLFISQEKNPEHIRWDREEASLFPQTIFLVQDNFTIKKTLCLAKNECSVTEALIKTGALTY